MERRAGRRGMGCGRERWCACRAGGGAAERGGGERDRAERGERDEGKMGPIPGRHERYFESPSADDTDAIGLERSPWRTASFGKVGEAFLDHMGRAGRPLRGHQKRPPAPLRPALETEAIQCGVGDRKGAGRPVACGKLHETR